jgi:SulP family sulfate permease
MLPDSEFAHLEHQPEKPVCPQLGVITIEGSLYFGATSHVEEEIRRTIEEHPEQRYLLLQMDKVNLIDISGLHMLETVVRLYRQQDGDIFMTGVRQSVRRKMTLSGFDEALGLDHFLAPNRAIEHIFYRILDPSICIYRCEIRAWRECQSLPKATRPAPLPEDALMPVTTPVRNLEPYDLWRKMLETSASSPLLIDVREAVEFEEYHIAQTQLIPMPEMLANPPDLPRDREIILICRTGRRSTQVARDMQRRGYQRVENLNGGILAWMDQGLPYVHESEQGSYTMIGEA